MKRSTFVVFAVTMALGLFQWQDAQAKPIYEHFDSRHEWGGVGDDDAPSKPFVVHFSSRANKRGVVTRQHVDTRSAVPVVRTIRAVPKQSGSFELPTSILATFRKWMALMR